MITRGSRISSAYGLAAPPARPPARNHCRPGERPLFDRLRLDKVRRGIGRYTQYQIKNSFGQTSVAKRLGQTDGRSQCFFQRFYDHGAPGRRRPCNFSGWQRRRKIPRKHMVDMRKNASVPSLRRSLQAVRRCNLRGERQPSFGDRLHFPLIMGHETTGEALAWGDKAQGRSRRFALADLLLGGMQAGRVVQGG